MSCFKSAIACAIGAMICGNAAAQEPDGYYSSCENATGAALLTKLCNKIASHTTVGYDELWDLYTTSDVDANGKLWDMYSTKRWTPGKERCGNYKNVGDCVNREHSFPKSWFNDAKPMYSDAFHLYPTDGKVNGQRSNFPFGECANGTRLPSNGGVDALGKLGNSTFPGYTGKVFEPDDEYKGDFARSYFYMAACYNEKIANWNSDMLAGNKYPAFSSWALNLLLKWHRQDPVSKKEIDRNNAVYARQRNRNPFIDHPELVEYIWGNKVGQNWSLNINSDPELSLPLDGSSLSFGTIGTGNQKTISVKVAGLNLQQAVSATVSGQGLSLGRASIPASEANSAEGASLAVTWTPAAAGNLNGTLTLTSGAVRTTVTLTGRAVDGLPALEADNVTATAFDARWVYVGDTDPRGCYTLYVKQGSTAVAGYPKDVPAAAERYTVTGLNENTTYTYYLMSASETSETVSVTTADLVPMITALLDDRDFFTTPNVPSASRLIELDVENVLGDVTVAVKAPFQVSADDKMWAQSVSLPASATEVYIRLGAAPVGEYESSVAITGDDALNDDIEVSGTVSDLSDVSTVTYFIADGYELADAEPDARIITLYNNNHDKSHTNSDEDKCLATPGLEHKSDFVTLVFAKGTGAQYPTVWYNAQGVAEKDARIYGGNTFTLTPASMMKIEQVQVALNNTVALKFNGTSTTPVDRLVTYDNTEEGPVMVESTGSTRISYIRVATQARIPDSIVDIDTDTDLPAMYYDLRGILVEQLQEGGVYIKVTSAGAEKVVY